MRFLAAFAVFLVFSAVMIRAAEALDSADLIGVYVLFSLIGLLIYVYVYVRENE